MIQDKAVSEATAGRGGKSYLFFDIVKW
jgi:hypothetical protein